jgi:hypothetical protein
MGLFDFGGKSQGEQQLQELSSAPFESFEVQRFLPPALRTISGPVQEQGGFAATKFGQSLGFRLGYKGLVSSFRTPASYLLMFLMLFAQDFPENQRT